MKAARTRTLILKKSAPVFNRKGFEGTSMADLEKVTGLTRGALYGHFNDKQAIAEAVFMYSIGTIKSLLNDALKAVKSNKQKLCVMLDFFARYVDGSPIPGGCPLQNTAVEADDHRVAMRGVVTGEMMALVNLISRLLKKGIACGEFKSDTDPRELAYTFFCAIEGAIMLSRVEGSTEPMDIIVNHCKNKLDQISHPYAAKTGSRNRFRGIDPIG